MKFTAQQIVEILKTPLGKDYWIDDPVVLAERKKIHDKYEELKSTPRLFTAEELRNTMHGKEGKDMMLIPGFTEASIEARAWWLQENILDA